MNKRQIKKFMRYHPMSWEPVPGFNGLSYLKLAKRSNDRNLQRHLRERFGNGMYWYPIPSQVKGITITYDMFGLSKEPEIIFPK
jgi:hypothetical protein